jgi:NTP pyrophosphatase (non-canonical NTP hydrolase)
MTDMKDMQKEVDEFIGQFKTGYFSPLAQMARLTEEVGELAREINHHYGEKAKKDSEEAKEVKEELGDLLFVIISLANSLDIDLSEAFDYVINKFNSRDHDRFERKESK